MERKLKYDAKDKEQRKRLRKPLVFFLLVLLGLLIGFSAIAGALISFFAVTQDNKFTVFTGTFLIFAAVSVGAWLWASLLILPLYGRNSVEVCFDEDEFRTKSYGSLWSVNTQTKYCDLNKVSISRMCKTKWFQKLFGYYTVEYKAKKEIRNKAVCKNVLGGFPMVYSLKEAEEIVAFLQAKAEEK